MMANSWIKPSVPPYGSPVLFVQKRTSKLWMCTDFFVLNSNTYLGVFTLPRIAGLLDKLGKTKLFSSIDLAYH